MAQKQMKGAQGDAYKSLVLSKSQRYPIYNPVKAANLSFAELEPANVWHFRLIYEVLQHFSNFILIFKY